MSEEDRERQFDSLVKGEETVKFTLTPQTVRDIDVSFTLTAADVRGLTLTGGTSCSTES
jgi:hypothetical protein